MSLRARLEFWVGSWIQLVEALIQILTFEYVNPAWWNRYTCWRIEKGASR